MHRLVFVVLSLAFLATGCQPAVNEWTEEQSAATEEEVRQAQEAMGTAWEARDVESWVAFFSDDVKWGGGEGPFVTLAEMEASVRELVPMVTDISSENVMFVTVLSPSVALVGLTYTSTMDWANGETTSDTGAMTIIWAQRDGEWKIVHGHSSVAAPEGT